MCLCVSLPPPCHDAMRHLEAVSCRWSASQPHPLGATPGAPGSPELPCAGLLMRREATPPLCHVSVLEGPAALSPSLRRPWRGGCGVPSVHLSGCRPCHPDACLTCLIRAMPVASLRVVSVWAGAGGRARLHLGGRLGPGVGTGPQPQGTVRWGVDGTGGALQEVCRQPLAGGGVSEKGWGGPESHGLHSLGQ